MPTAYQHVVVVMSILMGLAVGQLLRGIAQLYRTRKRIRTYWVHCAWIFLLLMLSLLLWWTYWNYRSIEDWSFIRFATYLSPTVAFYFLTAIVIPDPADAVTDLKEYYFANRVGFFGTFALYGVLAGLTAVTVRGLPLLDRSNLFRLAMVFFMLLAMRSTSERVHTVVLILSAILMFVFILFFQPRLG
jgi:hypothetical protein